MITITFAVWESGDCASSNCSAPRIPQLTQDAYPEITFLMAVASREGPKVSRIEPAKYMSPSRLLGLAARTASTKLFSTHLAISLFEPLGHPGICPGNVSSMLPDK